MRIRSCHDMAEQYVVGQAFSAGDSGTNNGGASHGGRRSAWGMQWRPSPGSDYWVRSPDEHGADLFPADDRVVL